ncbi:unnamed protein product [Heligmosomoides polygyrus]|uniref:DUF5641 domain-containing protein n=1 Tax=Heligmosomoides polygyrus TaxID=6339 RepID=A0A183GLR2_HELPZ|nr:unnamed protein product [Heligmosomoides polygyrus]
MFFVASLQPMDSQPGSYATTPKFSIPLIRSTTPQANIVDYCANQKISFNFIDSHSPWQGGVYERMVRNLVELWKTTNETLSSFWDQWNSEYLTSLREQYKRSHKHPRLENNSQSQFHKYVLIRNNTLQRGQWKVDK